MNQTVTSVCHDLRILPVSDCRRYARIGSEAKLVVLSSDFFEMGIPGTIKVTEKQSGEIWRKTITFDVRNAGSGVLTLLEQLRVIPLMAFYIDGHHLQKVSGSPDYPLTLKYKPGDGIYSVTLTGSDDHPDCYY